MTQRSTLCTKRSSEPNLSRAGDGDVDAFQARLDEPGAPSRAIRAVRIAAPLCEICAHTVCETRSNPAALRIGALTAVSGGCAVVDRW